MKLELAGREIKSLKGNEYIERYGRLHGWYLANILKLPTQNECYLITNEQELSNCYEAVRDIEMLYCRADAPWGQGNKLLRSRDLLTAELKSFFEENKIVCADAILIVFVHPSIWITKRYLPRYMTSGAAQVLLRKDGKVVIEIVGAGFDCGDISRGKAVHYRVESDKHTALFGLSAMLQESKRTDAFFEITQEEYEKSRTNRIQEMVCSYSNRCLDEIEAAVPKDKTECRKLAEIVLEECVYPVLESDEVWNDYVLMINIYDDRPYVYEVWQQRRSNS